MSNARVTDITAVRAFKVALVEFEEEASSTLEMMQMQLHRLVEWVEHEQPAYWTKQIQIGFEKVSQARTALSTCQMRTVAGRRPACIEEKQALAKAKQRLQYCQEMIPRVKRWSVKLTEESDEFRGRTAAFARVVETDLPRMIALIERTAAALERYAEVANTPLEESTPPTSSSEHLKSSSNANDRET
ncbi:MAG: hypothetical protein KDA93_08275 [Planctomycetaceae bacterium]|nr:hypothetical protein [Planctomycetaceae bacterium]